MIWRLAGLALVLVALLAGAQVIWRAFLRTPGPSPAVEGRLVHPPRPAFPAPAQLQPPNPALVSPAVSAALEPCAPAPGYEPAASQNAASLTQAGWSVFGRAETGWETYAPLVAQEIATTCAPGETGFARALAAWQGQHGLPSNGVMDAATLKALNILWLKRRPFVQATAHGACPPPPPAAALASASPEEGYLTKPVQLRAGALAAYRRMVDAARRELPAMGLDRRLMTIFSGYRDPLESAVRCASEGGCGTAARANCSAHGTGLAMDLFLGAAPGFAPESSADPNRLFQSRTDAYHWLVRNAARFGFVPYPFEPWHWEWTGEPP